jgi:hypothetical protein
VSLLFDGVIRSTDLNQASGKKGRERYQSDEKLVVVVFLLTVFLPPGVPTERDAAEKKEREREREKGRKKGDTKIRLLI